MKYIAQIENYQLLTPLPDLRTEKEGRINELPGYIPNLFNIIIGLAAVIAVGWIIWGGVEYMTSDSWMGKDDGKKRIKNAIVGLIIILCSYLILFTINPNILDLRLSIEPIEAIAPSIVGGQTGVGRAPTGACTGCVAMEFENNGGLVVATRANQTINSDTYTRLQNLENSLQAANLQGIITEGYNPTGHQNVCHEHGTCIDLNFTNESPATIRATIASARSAGLLPIFEVETPERRDAIVNACGTDQACRTSVGAHILVLPPRNGVRQITGEHFSVYNCSIDAASCATDFYRNALNVDQNR